MFALTIPGLAPLLREQLAEVESVIVRDAGFDGRADVVLFDAPRTGRALDAHLDIAEDLFVEVGRTLRSDGDKPHWIAKRIWRPQRVERALSIWAGAVRPLSARMEFRVIARLLQEQSFLRTELRREFVSAIRRDRPKWLLGDPAELEVWVVEYLAGRFVAGLRLSDARMRQRGRRELERQGALRPALAAAMVRAAGAADGRILDPCCGSGTILREGARLGWDVEGSDVDPEAVEIARGNTGGAAEIRVADARRLRAADGAFAAVVSNLPFGKQYAVDGPMAEWLRRAASEFARVVGVGGRVVLLAPDLPRDLVPSGLRLRDRYPVRLLGTRTTMWVFDRIAV